MKPHSGCRKCCCPMMQAPSQGPCQRHGMQQLMHEQVHHTCASKLQMVACSIRQMSKYRQDKVDTYLDGVLDL